MPEGESLLFRFSVFPPDEADGTDDEVGHAEHEQDAGVEAFAGLAAVFEVALHAGPAHGALGIGEVGGADDEKGRQEEGKQVFAKTFHFRINCVAKVANVQHRQVFETDEIA